MIPATTAPPITIRHLGLAALTALSLTACKDEPTSKPAASATAAATGSATAASKVDELRHELMIEEMKKAKQREETLELHRKRLKEFLDELPPKNSDQREELFVGVVREGLHDPLKWTVIQIEHEGHQAALQVSTDALKLHGVRMDVTAKGAQRIADLLGHWMPTARILQAIWEQADVRIKACNSNPDEHMADTIRMFQHSECVDERIGDRKGLVANVGKHWVLTNRIAGHPFLAANYGWFRTETRPWQRLGTAHDIHHTDYSQVLRFVKRQVIVDGDEMDIRNVAQSEELWGIVSDEGPLRITRMPIPVEKRPDTIKPPEVDPLVTAPALKKDVRLEGEGKALPLSVDQIPSTTEWFQRESFVLGLEQQTDLPLAQIPEEAFLSRAAGQCGGRDVFVELIGEQKVTRAGLEADLAEIETALACGRKILPNVRDDYSFSLIYMGEEKSAEFDVVRMSPSTQEAFQDTAVYAPLKVPPSGTLRARCMNDHGGETTHCAGGLRAPVQVDIAGGTFSIYAENWPSLVGHLNDPSSPPALPQKMLEVYGELSDYEQATVTAGKRCALIFDHSLAPRSLVETGEQTSTFFLSDHAEICALARTGNLQGGRWHDVYVLKDEATAQKLEGQLKKRVRALGVEPHLIEADTAAERIFLETLEGLRKRLKDVTTIERKGRRIDAKLEIALTEPEKKATEAFRKQRKGEVDAAAKIIALLEKGKLPDQSLIDAAQR